MGEIFLVENIRMIFKIVRNMSYTSKNQITLCKSEKLFKMILNFFVDASDVEITRDCHDIISNISQHIQLKHLPECDQFCERIYKYLESENNEEVESALDCLKNLIFTPENEGVLEGHLNQYLDTILDLMMNPKSDIRESVLEFFYNLSDLKMATRVTISKHPKCILRLVGLLVSGSGRNHFVDPNQQPCSCSGGAIDVTEYMQDLCNTKETCYFSFSQLPALQGCNVTPDFLQAIQVTYQCSMIRKKMRPFANKRYDKKFSPNINHPIRKLSYNHLMALEGNI